MFSAREQFVRRQEQPGKKTYRRPQLIIYGDLRELTRASGMAGAPDGALMGNTKTH